MRHLSNRPRRKKTPEEYARINAATEPIVARSQAGDLKALTEVLHRYRHVATFAAKRWARHLPSDFRDLQTVGLCGVWRAVQTYDPAKGASFLTWAVQWSLSYVQRHAHFLLARGGIAKSSQNWTNALTFLLDGGRVEDADAMAAQYGVFREDAERYLLGWGVWDFDQIKTGTSAHDPLLNAEEMLGLAEDGLRARQALQSLPSKESDIVKRHLEGETLQSIGETYGISRQRVEQVYSKVLVKLREMLEP